MTTNTLTDLNLEKSILACLIQSPILMGEGYDLVSPSDFSDTTTRDMYRIFRIIYENSGNKEYIFDLSTIKTVSKRNSIAEDFWCTSKGQAYYGSIEKESGMDIRSFGQYVKGLKELVSRRELYMEGERIKTLACDVSEKGLDVNDAIENAHKSLSEISAESVGHSSEPKTLMSDSATIIQKHFDEPRDLIGYSTGIEALDKSIEGYQKGRVYVVQAFAKTGKSAFLMNSAWSVIQKYNIPVLFISTEMGDEELMFRSISLLSQIEELKIRKGTANQAEKSKIIDIAKRIDAIPFHHIPIYGYSIETITSIIRRFIHKTVGLGEDHKAKDCLVIFDYIKMPENQKLNPAYEKETQILGMITTRLKDLCRELNFPLLTAAQENAEGGVAASIRITWFADCIMRLYNKSDMQISEEGGQIKNTGNQTMKIMYSRNTFSDSSIDLYFDRPRLTMRQATAQTSSGAVYDPVP